MVDELAIWIPDIAFYRVKALLKGFYKMTQYYYGTKKVEAWQMEKDGQPGYGVKYSDGYTSWSPKRTFEDAYRPFTALNFGHALEAIRDGYKVARQGWNGKGMFLYYVAANKYKANTEASRGYFGNDVPYGAYIAMKTAQENVVPWLASQTDMLSDDWQIV